MLWFVGSADGGSRSRWLRGLCPIDKVVSAASELRYGCPTIGSASTTSSCLRAHVASIDLLVRPRLAQYRAHTSVRSSVNALVSEFIRTRVGRIRWHADVLAAHKIGRAHDLDDGTTSKRPPVESDTERPSNDRRAGRAALFEVI